MPDQNKTEQKAKPEAAKPEAASVPVISPRAARLKAEQEAGRAKLAEYAALRAPEPRRERPPVVTKADVIAAADAAAQNAAKAGISATTIEPAKPEPAKT